MTGHLMSIANRQPVELAVTALDVQPTDNVLELGFGSGLGLALLGSRATDGVICGVDQSDEMVGQARRRNRAAIAAGRMEIVQGSFSRLGWPDGSFDAILLANVIYFFDTAGTDISEVHRVLRPGGRIAVYATDRSSMSRWPFCKPDTHRIFDRSQVEELLIQGGFARADILLTSCRLALGIEGIIAMARKPAR